jgi:hypothetical protein
MPPRKRPASKELKRPSASTLPSVRARKRPAASAKLAGSPRPSTRRRQEEETAEDAEAEEEEDEEGREHDSEVDPDRPPVSGSKPPDKTLPKTSRLEPFLLPVASQLPFHDFSDEAERKSFGAATSALTPGQILCCRLYRSDCSFDKEALIKMRQSQDYSMGPVVEGTFVGSSRPSKDARVSRLQKDGELLVHLCRQPGQCGRFMENPNLIHVHEWKCCAAEQIDHPWVSASMRQQMSGRDRSSSSSAASAWLAATAREEPCTVPEGALPDLPEKPKAMKSSPVRAASAPIKGILKSASAGRQSAASAPTPTAADGLQPVTPFPKTALQRLREDAEGLESQPRQGANEHLARIEHLRERLAEEKQKLQAAESLKLARASETADLEPDLRPEKEDKARDKDRKRTKTVTSDPEKAFCTSLRPGKPRRTSRRDLPAILARIPVIVIDPQP